MSHIHLNWALSLLHLPLHVHLILAKLLSLCPSLYLCLLLSWCPCATVYVSLIPIVMHCYIPPVPTVITPHMSILLLVLSSLLVHDMICPYNPWYGLFIYASDMHILCCPCLPWLFAYVPFLWFMPIYTVPCTTDVFLLLPTRIFAHTYEYTYTLMNDCLLLLTSPTHVNVCCLHVMLTSTFLNPPCPYVGMKAHCLLLSIHIYSYVYWPCYVCLTWVFENDLLV